MASRAVQRRDRIATGWGRCNFAETRPPARLRRGTVRRRTARPRTCPRRNGLRPLARRSRSRRDRFARCVANRTQPAPLDAALAPHKGRQDWFSATDPPRKQQALARLYCRKTRWIIHEPRRGCRPNFRIVTQCDGTRAQPWRRLWCRATANRHVPPSPASVC